MLMNNLFLISIGVLVLVVCIVLGAVLYFAAQGAKNQASGERKIVRLRSDSLRNVFRQAVELIEGNIASRAERYSIPWIMVLNEGNDERPLPISQSGVASALSSEAASPAATQGISWHFFDRGIVVDIQAIYLGSPDDEGDEKPWDEFLSLCRNYRPQRPFDSVVITVPAASLLAEDTDARLELGRRAKLAHRRLWLAQNRFAMRFAVYVVVTGCEELPGFSAFARALPESLRASMLGWSSPYDLSTTYQSDWIETAVGGITRAVSDSSAELFALDPGHLDASQFLLLPSRIESMQAQLQLYVDELLRPSAYHEPFFFRGIYLTGDSSEFAHSSLGEEVSSDAIYASAVDDPYGSDGGPAAAGAAVIPGRMASRGDSTLPPREPGEQINELMRQPAFLRDLFDKKIFLEYGLTRPSRSQHLARPVLNRTLRWGSIVLLGGWGIGLVVATVQLSHRNVGLVAALGELRNDAQERAAAAQRAQDLPPDWYRRKALALIALNERLRTDSAWTVFMPGSWSAVDDLDERVKERFAQAFGETAVTALEREMFSRVSQLTGVARDPSTGQLIVGDDCAAPAGIRGDARGQGSLAIEDLPELRALQQYTAAVDQFDTALRAMQRLQKPSPDNADALRLVVRYALGTELQGNVSGSLPYFYRDQGGRGEYSATAIGGLDMATLQQTLRCAFDKGSQQLDDRLFVNNPLLASERSVVEHVNMLSVTDASLGDFAQLTGNYRSVVTGINAQQELLAAGKGGWIRQAQFTPGPVYDRVFERATQNRLLGADTVARLRGRSDVAFQGFKSDLARRVGGADSGIVWVDKDARFAVSPERMALRDSLTGLLNQPFMVAPRDRPLPSIPDGSTITWDRTQIDQALALGDVRKRFLTEGLAKLPAVMQPAFEQALNIQFARLMLDLVASAAIVAPAWGETDSAAFDAARTRLVKLKALLLELGAEVEVDELDRLVSRDAMEHLRLVDNALKQSELYSTRQAAAANGTRSPVLAAFGIADAAALGPYLDQQSGRALALGKEAQVYLSALEGGDAASSFALRWQAIERDLDRYRLKNPNSSLLMLEQFVLTVAADPGADGCIVKFPGRPASNGADAYFAALHARLYDSLLARCSQGYVHDLRQAWSGFSSSFNRSLAGRYPFSGAGRREGEEAGSADFGEVGQVLKRYEGVAAAFAEVRKGAGARTVSAGLAVLPFIDNFDRVKTLLAPLYPSDDGAPTGYDLSVDFRVNRQGEVAANQVIDWMLRIGEQSVSLADAPHALHWNYGTPVSLVLRFAKDAPLAAVGDPQQRALITDGRTLTWQFADPWALLSFIERQRVPDTSLRADGTAQLLKFEFPLAAANLANLAVLPPQARGRVFLRLALTPAGKKIPLPWPGNFPARAPDWTAP